MPNEDPSQAVERMLDSGRNIRFGKGVVAKTSYVAAVAVVIWGIVAWRWSESWQADIGLLIAGVASTLFAAWFIRQTQKFAEKNPAQAILEGAELLEWRRMDEKIKGGPTIIDAPSIETTSVPRLDDKVEQ